MLSITPVNSYTYSSPHFKAKNIAAKTAVQKSAGLISEKDAHIIKDPNFKPGFVDIGTNGNPHLVSAYNIDETRQRIIAVPDLTPEELNQTAPTIINLLDRDRFKGLKEVPTIYDLISEANA